MSSIFFAPHLFANPPSNSCSRKRGQKNGGQKNEKQDPPATEIPFAIIAPWRAIQKGSKKDALKGSKSQIRDRESKIEISEDVFYLFAPHLFANPPSNSCSRKRGQKNGGQENEKQDPPFISKGCDLELHCDLLYAWNHECSRRRNQQ